MDSVGEGEGGKIWENGIETCIISCMKRDASPGSMHDTGCLGLVQWDDDGTGREEGSGWETHVYLWWIHFDIWQNQYNIVKFKNKTKKKKRVYFFKPNPLVRKILLDFWTVPKRFEIVYSLPPTGGRDKVFKQNYLVYFLWLIYYSKFPCRICFVL